MFWTVLHRAVDVMFLCLSATVLVLLLNISSDNATSGAFETEVKEVRQEVKALVDNTVMYLEGRVNKLAETQDLYQASTHQKIKMLEGRVKALEAENKDLKSQNKSVNSILIQNSGNNVVSN